MRVIGYARISRAMEDSTSLAKQRDILASTAKKRGWDLVGIEEDEDVSATKSRLDRPGLTRARQRIAAGEAEALVCWKLDRVARSVVDMGTLLDEGLQIASCTEEIDTTTPMGRAMVDILQVFAKLEADTTGQRLKATKAFLKTQRRWTGGPRPYGYLPVRAADGIGKELRVIESEAAVIRRIYSAILDGESVNGLARSLNTDGIPAAKGGSWTPASVLNIARALHVCGYLTEADGSGRKRRPVVDENGLPIVAWEPIIDAETAALVRAKVTPEALDEVRSAATKAGQTAPKRLLDGLAFCTCGAPLIRRNRSGRAYYGCRGLAEGKHTMVDAENAEAEVERQFLAEFSGVEVVERETSVSTTAALTEVETALAAATASILTTDSEDLPGLFARISDLKMEREALAATDKTVTVRRTFTPHGEAWDGWSAEEKRDHLDALGVTVRFRPAKRRGTWDPSRVVVDVPLDYLKGQTEDDFEVRRPESPLAS